MNLARNRIKLRHDGVKGFGVNPGCILQRGLVCKIAAVSVFAGNLVKYPGRKVKLLRKDRRQIVTGHDRDTFALCQHPAIQAPSVQISVKITRAEQTACPLLFEVVKYCSQPATIAVVKRCSPPKFRPKP